MPEESITHLTTESIKDFQTCSLLYMYRHKDQVYEQIPSRDLMSLRYENTIKKLAAFFFYKKQGGIVPSVSAILNRWEKLWFPKNASAYDIAVEQHESLWGNLSSMNTKAVNCIMQFYDDFANDNKDPILINEDFLTTISKSARIGGTFDLVLRDPRTKEISVIKWLASPKRPGMSTLSIDFAILKYAFESKNPDHTEKTRYYTYDIGSEKNELIEMDVHEADINSLLYWSKQIEISKVFVPRRGLTSYCKKCPFDAPCRNFNLTQEMIVKI